MTSSRFRNEWGDLAHDDSGAAAMDFGVNNPDPPDSGRQQSGSGGGANPRRRPQPASIRSGEPPSKRGLRFRPFLY